MVHDPNRDVGRRGHRPLHVADDHDHLEDVLPRGVPRNGRTIQVDSRVGDGLRNRSPLAMWEHLENGFRREGHRDASLADDSDRDDRDLRVAHLQRDHDRLPQLARLLDAANEIDRVRAAHGLPVGHDHRLGSRVLHEGDGVPPILRCVVVDRRGPGETHLRHRPRSQIHHHCPYPERVEAHPNRRHQNLQKVTPRWEQR